MNRRGFLERTGYGALAGMVAGRGHEAVSGASRKRPNILLILVDDLGYGDLSSYGAGDMETPNIDRLMASGARMDDFYSNCPVCSPTRAALLTGRFPDLVGVPGVIRTHADNNFGYLSEQAELLPEVLGRAGYHTALVGKWHLGLESPNTPLERGFDFFHGFLGDMMDDYYTHLRHGINYMRKDLEVIEPRGHATDLFSDWSIDYINRRSREKDPFFLYLAYNAPHTPVQPPEEWLDKVKRREPGMGEDRARLVALIEHLDSGIGRVLDSLQQNGIAEDTLVVFTSDNGGLLRAGASNGSLRGGKQDMYEGGIRVPACFSWPGKIAPGQKNRSVGLTMDLFPTLCELAGASSGSTSIDGISLAPAVMEGRGMRNDRELFWVRREGSSFGARAYYAARQGDFKLLQNSPFEPMELFNLADDPGETRPLGTGHEMYGKLFGALHRHIQKSGAVPWQKIDD